MHYPWLSFTSLKQQRLAAATVPMHTRALLIKQLQTIDIKRKFCSDRGVREQRCTVRESSFFFFYSREAYVAATT